MNLIITIEDKIKDTIFNFIYEMALRDATAQRAYKCNEGEKKQPLFNKEAPKKLTKKYIDDLLIGQKTDFYKTASEIEKSFNDIKFTFGNTQKLMNMTVKYMYITFYQNNDSADLHKKFKDCHCPMDNIIIKKVITELKEILKNKEDEKIVEQFTKPRTIKDKDGTKKTVKWTTFLQQPWSRISQDNKGQYVLFQDIVKYLSDRENINPIEYDYIHYLKDKK